MGKIRESKRSEKRTRDQVLSRVIASLQGDYEACELLREGTKWESGKSSGDCYICGKTEPDGYNLEDWENCDDCRKLTCSKCYVFESGECEEDLGISTPCKNRFDGINHPMSRFCGVGCGCMDKKKIILCKNCKDLKDFDDTVIVIKRKKKCK